MENGNEDNGSEVNREKAPDQWSSLQPIHRWWKKVDLLTKPKIEDLGQLFFEKSRYSPV